MDTAVRSGELPPVDRDEVLSALCNIYDPCCEERGISIVDMGLPESIEVSGGEVRVDLVLTSGWCPFSARVLGMVEEEVGGLPGVESVEVEVVWEPAWTPERMSDEAREKLRLPLERLLPMREARVRGEQG